MKRHILVAEDDETIAELIRYNLEKSGFRVSCCGSGEKALLAAGVDTPDLVILDVLLPGIDGVQVCRLLRGEQKTREVPIVMVTAKGEEHDIVEGLDAGADDYVTKPFSPKVLLARVQAVLRRRAREPSEEIVARVPLRVHELVIDPQRHKVLIGDARVELTLSEFQVLYLLAGQPGRVFTRYQIVESVRGSNYHVTDRAVDVLVFGLRKKLGDYGVYLETVRGIGYRFAETADLVGG